MTQSNLVEKLCTIFSLAKGRPLSTKEADAINESVDSHGLLQSSPEWMLALLDNIQNSRLVKEYIPAGYPEGEQGLTNIFADISEVSEEDIDDYGEGIKWNIPNLGISMFVCRETIGADYFYQISKCGEE